MFDFGPDNYVDSRNASQFDEFISTLSGIVGVSVVSPVLPDIKQIIDEAYDYYNGNNVPKDC